MLISSFRSGNYIISVFDSIKSELAEKWDTTNPGSLNSSYLTLLEDSKPEDINFRYVIVEKENNDMVETCAILYFQLLKFTKKNIHFNNSFLLSSIASVILKLRPFRILLCGNFFAVNFPGIKFNPELFDDRNLLLTLEELGKLEKNDVFILKDMDIHYTGELMSESGWMPYTTDLTMILDIHPAWKNLNDYKSDLKKKYRTRTAKIISSGEKIERRELNEEEILKNNNQIMELFRQVADKQTIRMGLIGRNYFYEYKKRFPEAFTFIGYFYENDLVAFSTYIDQGLILEIHYIGINYSFNKDLMIYFNILLDGVEMAIIKNKKQLELGRTAREAKANLGGSPVYFNDYLKIKSMGASFLSKIFRRYFLTEMGNQWTNKHPFGK